MILAALTVLLIAPVPTALDYSGLPVLKSPTSYRILTSSTNVEFGAGDHRGSDGTVTVSSTTVYRNLGGMAQATIVLPRHRVAAPGSGGPTFPISATWDNRPLTLVSALGLQFPNGDKTDTSSDLTSTVSLRSQGTHALRVTYSTQLQQSGYGAAQLKTAYLLDGSTSIDLLSVNFRCPARLTLGLPKLEPDLDWQISEKGASIRKTAFSPSGQFATFEFYPNSFKRIG